MVVVDICNKWFLGCVIKICFLDGFSDIYVMVEEVVWEWECCVNLWFEFGYLEWNFDVCILFYFIYVCYGIGFLWFGFGIDVLMFFYVCNMYLDV